MAPLKIGLTGGIAAGKSEALAAFGRLGAATLSSDAVVHELLEGEPLRGRLAERWGPEVDSEDGVDRAKVGEIVFADPEQLTWLEGQIHPLVQKRTAEWLTSLPAGTEIAVVEVPLLFEAGSDKVFDTTVAVVTADEVRQRRAAARGHALVGAVLGGAGAYLALAATYHDNLGYLGRVPAIPLTLIVLGVPLAAIAAGWLLAGREPPAIARAVID